MPNLVLEWRHSASAASDAAHFRWFAGTLRCTNPNAGIVEPEEMDFREVLAVASPYLGELVGEFTDWTPLAARNRLFVETVDTSDPWQFSNLRA